MMFACTIVIRSSLHILYLYSKQRKYIFFLEEFSMRHMVGNVIKKYAYKLLDCYIILNA